MLYSSAALLALIIHLIINHDVLFLRHGRTELIPAQRAYRLFLYSVLAYYITDILWGILYEHHLMVLITIDTALYFFTMGCSIQYWTAYTVEYLREKNTFGKILKQAGKILFVSHNILILVNFFIPVLFSFDREGVYHAEPGRYISLAFQIIMFILTAFHAFRVSADSQGTMKVRHTTIGLFSIALAGFSFAQVLFPLLPLYAIGCMLGSCVLHSFILENERNEYRENLEEKLKESILNGNYYDLLTGLSGMTYFFETADRKRKELIRKGGKPAFLYLDLTGLKFFNHRFGFGEGDRLLQAFASLLTRTFGEENCSRFSSDHFVVFADQNGLDEKLQKFFEDWKNGSEQERPAVRVGVYPDDGSVDISTACDGAKTARDVIRSSYVSAVQYFTPEMLAKAEHRQYIISHLDQALEKKWIQVYYQPIIRAANGRVCDEEALARWIDPERGFLSPADFIPILEDAHLIYRLDLYVIDEVLKKLQNFRDKGFYLVPQSVNLSRSDFDACDMVETICQKTDSAKIERRLLTIEITESIVGSDFEFIREQINRFRAAGFSVWMDDFGSGYSSLDVLSNVTVDLIKLDMRFMQQFDSGDKSRVILTELMKMAIGLGIDTVCEGVERQDQLEFMRDIGCTKLQGYYYLPPISLNQIIERYEKGIQIGFENPKESSYYDSIGRINLYDLAVISQEETNFQHYFNTIPMAIIEIRGRKMRFARSNQAYRDFMKVCFNIDVAKSADSFIKFPEGAGKPFIEVLEKQCRDGGRSIMDETLPDGTVVHSFIRKIADNAVTNTAAAVVAVLTVNDPKGR